MDENHMSAGDVMAETNVSGGASSSVGQGHLNKESNTFVGDAEKEKNQAKGCSAVTDDGPRASAASPAECSRPRCLRPCLRLSVFLVVFYAQLLLQGVQGVYFSAIITTLEHRFGWHSSRTGLLNGMSTIGNASVAIFVGQFGRRWHKPRVFALAMFAAMLAAIMDALPHFLYGPGQAFTDVSAVFTKNASGTVQQDASLQTCGATRSYLSSPNSTVTVDVHTGINSHVTSSSSDSWESRSAFWIFFVAETLYGVGGASIWSLGVTFLDDVISKRTIALAIGSFMGIRFMSPVLAFALASVTLKLPVNLAETWLTPDHPRWLGAWWLGYIVCACVMLLLGTLMLMFPREFPKPHNDSDEIMDECATATTVDAPGKANDATVMQDLKDLPRALLRLGKNFIWMTTTLAVCTDVIQFGYFSFALKYMETQFQQTAFMTSVLGGLIPSLVGLVSSVLSGSLISRFRRQTPVTYTRITVICVMATSVCLWVTTLLGCPEVPLAGRTGDSVQLTQACNANCSCPTGLIDPVCGADGVVYYSACHAGCSGVLTNYSKDSKLYLECSCVGSYDNVSLVAYGYPGNATATAGLCPTSCQMLVPFIVVGILWSFVWNMYNVPTMNTLLRVVDERDRALAMGFVSFMISLLVFPSPTIYGLVIDDTCLISGGQQGACQLYNRRTFRLHMHGFTIGIQLLAALLYVAAFIKAWLERSHARKLGRKYSLGLSKYV